MNIQIGELTKVSSKGQVVIPKEYREDMKLKEGSFLSVGMIDELIVMKKITPKLTKEELKTLKEIKEAWKEIENGKYVKFKTKKDALKELTKW